MKLFIIALTVLLAASPKAFAIQAYLYDSSGNPISATAGALNVKATVTSSNASIGLNTAAGPTSSTQVGGQDNLGNLQPLKLTAAKALVVDGSAATQPVSGTVNAAESGTWTVQPGNTANTTPWLFSLSQGGNTAAVTVGGALKVDASATTQPISGTVTANQGAANATPWNENLTQFGGSAVTLGQKVMASSIPVTVASDQSAMPMKLNDGGGTSVTVGQKVSASSLPVVIASDQSVLGTKSPVNTNGSHTTNTTIGSVSAVTLTVPANAVGFMIEASSGNTVNLRWAVGATATTTAGMRLEPGRDSGFIPSAANVSVIAESGTNQEVEIQWILSQ